jgi:hypothetical protein
MTVTVSIGDIQLIVCSRPQEVLVLLTFTKFTFGTSKVHMQMDRGLKSETTGLVIISSSYSNEITLERIIKILIKLTQSRGSEYRKLRSTVCTLLHMNCNYRTIHTLCVF